MHAVPQLDDTALPDEYTRDPVLQRSVIRRNGAGALVIEALGGTAGFALGFGAVVLATGECGENLSCTLGNAAMAVLLGSVGGAAGTYAAGRLGATEPSGVGAVIGAVVGAAAVVGVDHVLSGVNTSDAARYAGFAVTHGLITAIGSRIGAALR